MHAVRDLTDRLFSTINMNNDINSDYDKILTALHTAARMCVPRGKISFFKILLGCWPGWLESEIY